MRSICYFPLVGGWICWLDGVGSVEARSERVNLGTVLLAITLIGFYVTEVIARFDRSLTLLGLGLFFFLGGWGLNRLRQAMLPGLPGGDA